MVNQCCSLCNDSSCSGGMSAPVISFLWALQSSQICRQYFVSCCVRLGIALSLALSISASLCGGAKRTVVGGRGCSVGGGSSGSGAGRLRCVDSYSSLGRLLVFQELAYFVAKHGRTAAAMACCYGSKKCTCSK